MGGRKMGGLGRERGRGMGSGAGVGVGVGGEEGKMRGKGGGGGGGGREGRGWMQQWLGARDLVGRPDAVGNIVVLRELAHPLLSLHLHLRQRRRIM
jgi:hypothetical protein